MSSPEKYVPKHRAPGAHKLKRERPRLLHPGMVTAGVAVAATGVAVSTGVLAESPEVLAADAAGAPSGAAAEIAADRLAERGEEVSRSDRRAANDPTKRAVLSATAGLVTNRAQRLSQSDPRDIARALLPQYGFSASQFSCLDQLYVSESGWRVDADNPTSSAYGIPQALTQTHDLPEGYMTSAEVQIRWGLEYIANRYGTPCSAWSFKAANNWY